MSKVDDLFNALDERIKKLREHFLKDRKEDEDLTQIEEDFDLYAFSLIVHALFEAYFENLCEYVLEASLDRWASKKQQNKTILCLLSYYSPQKPERRDELHTHKYLHENLMYAKSKHRQKIRDNNGIKTKNIQEILGPIGIDSYIDAHVIASLETFGQYRGDIAHTANTKTIYGIVEVNSWIEDGLTFAQMLRQEANEILS